MNTNNQTALTPGNHIQLSQPATQFDTSVSWVAVALMGVVFLTALIGVISAMRVKE